MYNDFDTFPHLLIPSTPAHLFTCPPVHLCCLLLTSPYHDTLMRYWYLDVKILWVKILWVKTVYTLMSRYIKDALVLFVYLSVVISIHGSTTTSFTASFMATWSANIHDQLISICLIRLTFDALRVAYASKLSSNIWLWCGRMVGKVSMSWE